MVLDRRDVNSGGMVGLVHDPVEQLTLLKSCLGLVASRLSALGGCQMNRETPPTMLDHLPMLNLNAAGLDIGSAGIWAAVPPGRDKRVVREFGTFTPDLLALAEGSKQCRVDTVVMESTGVYWIPTFEILDAQGFQVQVVNARHVKNVPGRKTDEKDCQWLQR
jgi:hypothetical protein